MRNGTPSVVLSVPTELNAGLADLAIAAYSAGLLPVRDFDGVSLDEKVRWGAYVACIAGSCKNHPIQNWLKTPYKQWQIPEPHIGLDTLDHKPYRHLIYHLYPSKANRLWRWHAAQLWKYWHIFTGRKVIAIAIDRTTVSSEEAIKTLPEDAECIVLPNDPMLREMLSLPILLAAIRSDSGYVWMAHSKGNSTAENRTGALLWTKTMYRVLFEQWEEVLEDLKKYPCVGTTKIVWPKDIGQSPYPSGLKVGNWMSAGSFTVWKHAEVFKDPKYRRVPVDRYGWEAFPSIIWPDHHSCHSRYQPWPTDVYPAPSPYLPKHYEPQTRVCQVSGPA